MTRFFAPLLPYFTLLSVIPALLLSSVAQSILLDHFPERDGFHLAYLAWPGFVLWCGAAYGSAGNLHDREHNPFYTIVLALLPILSLASYAPAELALEMIQVFGTLYLIFFGLACLRYHLLARQTASASAAGTARTDAA